MVAHSAGFSRQSRSRAFFSLLLFLSAALLAVEKKAAFLTFAEVAETLRLFADSGLPGSDITDSAVWDRWIRDQDAQVRARIDRGVEDSISNLVLYGISYTSLPRMESSESAVTEAGKVSDPARARVHALFVALGAVTLNERARIVHDVHARNSLPDARSLGGHFASAELRTGRFAARARQQGRAGGGKDSPHRRDRPWFGFHRQARRIRFLSIANHPAVRGDGSSAKTKARQSRRGGSRHIRSESRG